MGKVCTDYENLILLGDFNVETEEKHMPGFMSMYNVKNLIKPKTCFKNLENPSCIDLVLTNYPQSFQKSNFFKTGLSDFQEITVTVLEQYFSKQKLKVIIYRDYQNFQNDKFREKLDNEIWNVF